MINLSKEPLANILEPVETTTTQGVLVDKAFYNKLIETAYNSFRTTTFYDIKGDLKAAVENAANTDDLIAVCKEFIDTREFVDKVTEETKRIHLDSLN